MTDMLTKETFKELLQNIVNKHLPDEAIIFEIQADEIIEDTFNDKYSISESGHGDKFGMLDLPSTKLVVDLIAIVFTAYKTYWEVTKLKKESKEIALMQVKERWISKLKSSGINSAKAKAIANDFFDDIVKLAK